MSNDKQHQKIEKLHQIIKDGDTSAAKKFINSLGRDAKEVCSFELPRDGNSLHLAARLGHVEITKEILKTGIDINKKQMEGLIVSGKTALHEAVRGGHFGQVEFLLSRGADVNIQESDGFGPLHISCQHDNTDIVKCLVRNGGNLDLLDNKGISPLQMSILRGPDETTRYLIKSGANVHITDVDGQSPLHYASEWGNLDIVSVLLAQGAKVNLVDNENRTALHVATDDDVYDLLVKHGCDTTIRDSHGKPARESQIDTTKKEYQDINNALSKHTDLMKKRNPQMDRIDLQARRVFSPGPPIPEVELKTARSNMLKELLKKTDKHGSNDDLSDQLETTHIQ